jgi:hypothetical protein
MRRRGTEAKRGTGHGEASLRDVNDWDACPWHELTLEMSSAGGHTETAKQLLAQ